LLLVVLGEVLSLLLSAGFVSTGFSVDFSSELLLLECLPDGER
jgi:hypothetical protein